VTLHIDIMRTKPFGEAAARTLRALPFAHRAEEGAMIGVAQLIACPAGGHEDIRDRGLVRLGYPLFEPDQALEPFKSGSAEHAANRYFGRDPYWGVNVGLRDARPGTSVATVACGLRDALVLRNETPDWPAHIPAAQRLEDLTVACEVHVAKDISNHGLIEALAGAEAFLRADLSSTCDVPPDEISLRLAPSDSRLTAS